MNRISNISTTTAAFCLGAAVFMSLVVMPFQSPFQPLVHAARDTSAVPSSESGVPTEHVILFVLEGLGQESLKSGAMPVLSTLVKDGAVTWSAKAVAPARRLPTMASLVTGMRRIEARNFAMPKSRIFTRARPSSSFVTKMFDGLRSR